MSKQLTVLLLGCALMVGACSSIPTYRMDIEQGNIVTDEMFGKLKVGMTKEQVKFLLGEPSLSPYLNTQRWDYINSTTKGHRTPKRYHIILFFKDDVLEKISGDNKPL